MVSSMLPMTSLGGLSAEEAPPTGDVSVSPSTASEGLEYYSRGDGTCYVSGIGTCTDTDVVIPSVSPEGDAVVEIGNTAFWNGNCTSITSITIPAGVIRIGPESFAGCTSLESIIVAEDNPVYHSTANCLIETASQTLVSVCKNGVIPDDGSVTTIGTYAFYFRTNLESITIPESVTSINHGAFYCCTNLASVTLPESMTSIGTYAFAGCTSLESITIPAGVTSIGVSSFANCTSLASITILNSNCELAQDAIPATATIYGYTGSTAQTYAETYGNTFVSLDRLESYPEITLGEMTTVEIDEAGETLYFRFTPERSGEYNFYSVGSYDTFGDILNGSMNGLASDDDSGDGFNFHISYYMDAGTTYLLSARMLDSTAVGSFDLCVEEAPYITSLEIVSLPTRTEYIKNFWWEEFSNSGLVLRTVWSNGEVFDWTAGGDWYVNDEYINCSCNEYEDRVEVILSCGGLSTSYTVNLLAPEEAVATFPEITLGESKTAEIAVGGASAFFLFTPEKDGRYAFCSNSETDPYGYVLDTSLNEVARDDDSAGNYNFRVICEMTAGTTYVLRAKYYSSANTGSYQVWVEELATLSSLEIVSLPTRTEYIEDTLDSEMSIDGILLRTTWSDGEVIDWTTSDAWNVRGEEIFYKYAQNEDTAEVFVYCGDLCVVYTVTLIEAPIPGDADGDGTVSMKDATLIQQYLNGWDVESFDAYAADVNNDGIVDLKDAILVRQYLNGWGVVLN